MFCAKPGWRMVTPLQLEVLGFEESVRPYFPSHCWYASSTLLPR